MKLYVPTLKYLAAAAILAVLAAPAPAHATVIDTTGSDAGIVVPFGDPNTATYGQTFTVAGADSFLDSFSLYLRTRFSGAGTLDLRGYIASWDGSKASAILFESATQTMNAAGALQEFAFDPNLNLISGDTYVAFLSISNLPDQTTNTFQMPLGGESIPGSMVFINNGQNFGLLTTIDWIPLGTTDVWFQATLLANGPSAVPEPITLSLLGAGLAGIGAIRRRRG